MSVVQLRLFGRLIVAAVFGFAGIAKLVNAPPTAVDDGGGAATLYESVVAGRPAVHYAIAAGELTLAAWLVGGLAANWSALAAISMLSLFSGLLLVELTREQPRPCGCTANAYAPTSVEAVRRSLVRSLALNAGLMAVAATTTVGIRISVTTKPIA